MKKLFLLLTILTVVLCGSKPGDRNAEAKNTPKIKASSVESTFNSTTEYLRFYNFELIPALTADYPSYLVRGEASLQPSSLFPIGTDGYAYFNFTGGIIQTEDRYDPVSFVLSCDMIQSADYIELESGPIGHFSYSFERNRFHIHANNSGLWLGKNVFICHCRDFHYLPIKIRVTIEIIEVVELG